MSNVANSKAKFHDLLQTRSLARIVVVMLIGISGLVPGCHSSSSTTQRVDKTVARYAKSGQEAYAEGHVETAIEKYRQAIRRAWAIDDPYESGTNAYNLAACMTSLSRNPEAQDWLLDARVELCRAGASTGNIWLLSAKIALQESRFEDAQWFVDRAACSDPPCEGSQCEGLCGPADPCREKCITKIPCVGSKIERKEEIKACEDAYQAQIHLTRARMAAEQYDLETAYREFQRACELVENICGYELQAELQNVAALIHIAKGEYLQAGWHLDKEAENLRLAGNYREIPTALQLAAAAYEQAGLIELAADRLCRVARILYGRGETKESWRYVERATMIAEAACSESTKTRLALLANEILLALDEEGESPPPPSQEASPELSFGSAGGKGVRSQKCKAPEGPFWLLRPDPLSASKAAKDVREEIDLQAALGDAALDGDGDVTVSSNQSGMLGGEL